MEFEMKDRIRLLISNWPKLWRTRKASDLPYVIAFLDKCYPGVPLNLQINALLNGQSPYCIICNTPVKTLGKVCCSTACRSIHGKETTALRLQKQKITLLEKYGVDNIRKIPGVESKRTSTMMEKYGAAVSPITREKASARANELNAKGKVTLLQNYNVTNPGQLPSHSEKCKGTLLKKYGSEIYAKSQQFKQITAINREIRWKTFLPNSIKFVGIYDATEFKKTVFNNPNKLVKFTCVICNISETLPTETVKWRIRNTGTCCTACSGLTYGSLAQTEINNFIASLGIKTIINDRTILKGKEIDILIPEYNIGIEYNGLYWHNDLKVHQNYHFEKTLAASKANIKLIHIFEDEWVHTPDIVKSKIRHLLHRTKTKVFARSCEIKEVNAQEADEFLLNHHIQGHCKSTVNFGLFHNSELVSVMSLLCCYETGCWELTRYSSAVNTVVVGGLSKLFSHFKSVYQPTQVSVLIDTRWSSGTVFKLLHFTHVVNSLPVAWQVNLTELKRLQVTNLDTEFITIWDCGSSKWEWNCNQ